MTLQKNKLSRPIIIFVFIVSLLAGPVMAQDKNYPATSSLAANKEAVTNNVKPLRDRPPTAPPRRSDLAAPGTESSDPKQQRAHRTFQARHSPAGRTPTPENFTKRSKHDGSKKKLSKLKRIMYSLSG